MDRIMASKKDFVTGALCFVANGIVTLVGVRLPGINNSIGTAIVAVQICLFIATIRCWLPHQAKFHLPG
jgi:hypothetical protein